MPELPEVETIRNTLKPLVVGKRIDHVSIYYNKMIEGDASVFSNSLEGESIQDIDRVGKYLIFKLDHHAFLSHLRMEGKYFYYEHSTPPNKHTHVVFYFNDQSELHYQDTRKFGRMQLVPLDNYKNVPPLDKLAKEPFDITVDDLYPIFKNTNRGLKEILLDQQVILGIGNIYANEICFYMKMHPASKVKYFSKKRTQQLIDAAIQVLNEAIKQGGTTIHTFSANGIDGMFQVHLQVHGRENQPCRICGTTIRKIKIGGRGTYFCPTCQKRRR